MKRTLLSIIIVIFSLNCAYALDHPANYKIKNHLKSDTTRLLFENLKTNELDSFLRFSWSFSPQIKELLEYKRIVVKYAVTDSLTPATRLRLGYPWVMVEFDSEDRSGLLSQLKPATSYTWNIGLLDSDLPLRIVDENKIIWQFSSSQEPIHFFKKSTSWLIYLILSVALFLVLGIAMKKMKN